MTTVVNLKHEPYDVYIGRAGKGQDGYLGNPFRLEREEDRDAVLEAFRNYFVDRVVKDAEYRKRVTALKDKRLGCFCAPKKCHGDVIANWLNSGTF